MIHPQVIKMIVLSRTILTLKINNHNASNWMVRDFSNCNYCNTSSRSRFPIALKIGLYIGKFKSTLNSFQKEVSSATKEIDLEEDIAPDKDKTKKDIDKNVCSNSFTSHFIELRSRLLNSLIFIFIVFIFSYIFAEQIYNFLVEPYANAVKDDQNSRRLIFTAT